MTHAEQLNNIRILREIEQEFERNPDSPEFKFLKKSMRSSESLEKSYQLDAGWYTEAAEKINNAVAAGVLPPDALLFFSSDPLHVLEQMSKSVRDELGLPDPKQAAETMVKSFQNSGRLW